MSIPTPVSCINNECPTPSLCFEHGEECRTNENDPQGVVLARKGKGNGGAQPGGKRGLGPLTGGSLTEGDS
mgnify:CR=1 FL=1